MQKIVFVIESLQVGGAEKSLITLLQNLNYEKFEITLILFTKEGLFFNQVPTEVKIDLKISKSFSLIDRVRFKILRIKKQSKFHNSQIFWPIAKTKWPEDTNQYDIAVAYNQGFSTYYVADCIIANKKLAWLNTNYHKAGYNIKFDFSFYKNFYSLVAVSKEAKYSIAKELDKINKNLPITVIKDISDKESIAQLSKEKMEVSFSNNKINIVTVARLDKPKGLHLAITSSKILIDKGYEINWYVVGDGSEHHKLHQLIKQNQLENSFFLIGAKINPYPYMENCDIYVQTSLFEGLCLTAIEASYLNKPIVATNFDTIYSIIEDEVTGLVAEMNQESIAGQIERLIVDKELRNRFSQNLSKLVNNDKEISLEQLNELFNS